MRVCDIYYVLHPHYLSLLLNKNIYFMLKNNNNSSESEKIPSTRTRRLSTSSDSQKAAEQVSKNVIVALKELVENYVRGNVITRDENGTAITFVSGLKDTHTGDNPTPLKGILIGQDLEENIKTSLLSIEGNGNEFKFKRLIDPEKKELLNAAVHNIAIGIATQLVEYLLSNDSSESESKNALVLTTNNEDYLLVNSTHSGEAPEGTETSFGDLTSLSNIVQHSVDYTRNNQKDQSKGR